MSVRETAGAGVFATLLMTAAVPFAKLLGIEMGEPGLLCRWLVGMAHGKLVQRDIAAAPVIRGETALATLLHFVIGVGLAAIYFAAPARVRQRAPLLSGVVFGVATVLLPWLWMYPAMGYGWFGRRGPPGTLLFATSLATHALYGVGLGVWVRVLHPWLRARRSTS